MAKPASEGALGELHVLVAAVLKERISNKDSCTTADILATIKFLKDNNMQATPQANTAMAELADELGRASVEDVSEAEQAELDAALANVLLFPGSVANA